MTDCGSLSVLSDRSLCGSCVSSRGGIVSYHNQCEFNHRTPTSIHFSRSLDLLSLYLETAPRMPLHLQRTLETLLHSSLAPPLLSLCFLCHWSLSARVRFAGDMDLEAQAYQTDRMI